MKLNKFDSKIKIMFLYIAMFLCFDYSLAQDAPFTVSASYKADYVQNMSGGLEVGGGYLGYGQMGLSIDFEALNLWKNGELFIGGATTHGAMPSASFIGDFQVADNIEAGEHVYLEQFWFRQDIGQFMLKVGLQDLNEYFVESTPALEYINSSFGINSVISANMDAPIFPVMGLGVELHYSISDNLHAQLCVSMGSLPISRRTHIICTGPLIKMKACSSSVRFILLMIKMSSNSVVFITLTIKNVERICSQTES